MANTSTATSSSSRQSFAEYLSHHALAPLLDGMLEACTAAVQYGSGTTTGVGVAAPAGGNLVCDAMSSVVASSIYQRCALGSKQSVPPDVLNSNPANSAVGLMRNHFSGKRVLVLSELPTHVVQSVQHRQTEERGPSLMTTLRLELLARTIVSVLQLGSVPGGGRHGAVRLVLGLLMTDSQSIDGKLPGGAEKKARPTAAVLDDAHSDFHLSDMDDEDISPMEPSNDSLARGRSPSISSRGSESPPLLDIRAPGVALASTGAAGGGGGDGSSSGGPLAGSALHMLASMLQGEGIDVEFLPSHVTLLQNAVFSMETYGPPGGSSSSMLHPPPPGTASTAAPGHHPGNSPGGGAASNSGESGVSGGGDGGSWVPPKVSILPTHWIPSKSSTNLLSVLDPLLAFADCVVVEGLEWFRIQHPLVYHVPRAVGNAFLGAGASLELDALRSLFTGGASSHRKIDLAGSPLMGNNRLSMSSLASSSVAATTNNTSLVSSRRARLLIVGDDELEGEMPVSCAQPTAYASTLVHLADAFEDVVYLFDYVLLTGSAAMVHRHVQRRRRLLRAEAIEAGSNEADHVQIEWATPTEAGVAALLDAVDRVAATVPGGCEVHVAPDFTFVKKTTSGNSKIDIISLESWNRTEAFSVQRRAPPKFYYTDVGTSSKELLSGLIERCSMVVGLGSLTRCDHHCEGTRAAKMPYSAVVKDEVQMFTSAAHLVISQCRAQRTQLLVFGEHWCRAAATESGCELPLPPYAYAPPILEPPALVALCEGSTATSHLGAAGLSTSVTDGALHPSRSSRSMRRASRSPSAIDTLSPLSKNAQRASAAPPPPPRPKPPACLHLLKRRFGAGRSVQEELCHVSTCPYREVGRLLRGEYWESLRIFPCPVVPRSAAGGK